MSAPLNKIRNLFNGCTTAIDKRIPKSVPRDKTTKRLIGAAAAVYLVDIWDPLPIGETVASVLISCTIARGVWVARNKSNKPEIKLAPK